MLLCCFGISKMSGYCHWWCIWFNTPVRNIKFLIKLILSSVVSDIQSKISITRLNVFNILKNIEGIMEIFNIIIPHDVNLLRTGTIL